MLYRIVILFCTLFALSACAHDAVVAQSNAHEGGTVKVMVLGTYHFANPGADAFNIEVDNVLSETRQKEIEAVTSALAEWKPTKILVEFVSEAPDLTLSSYRDFDPGRFGTDPNEVYQIGYRLAKKLNHEDVYGFDEQPSEGEPDYFPLGNVFEYAESVAGQPIIDGLMAYQTLRTENDADYQRTHTIAQSLMRENDPASLLENHLKLYYGVLEIGDGVMQPGAELNAYWYMRNAKMFAKADMIADPGDRLLILVGSGHQFWLSHFVDVLPGYVEVDPIPYLERADP